MASNRTRPKDGADVIISWSDHTTGDAGETRGLIPPDRIWTAQGQFREARDEVVVAAPAAGSTVAWKWVLDWQLAKE